MESQLPQRKNLRLPQFDYRSEGAYYVTLCTQGKKPLLCRIIPGPEGREPRMDYTSIGKTAEEFLRQMPGIDKFVIMPNHIHLIVFSDGKGLSLGRKIQIFKGNVTRRIKQSIWQREYYEHVIRDEADYQIKWKYIDDNPSKWASDEYYYRSEEK